MIDLTDLQNELLALQQGGTVPIGGMSVDPTQTPTTRPTVNADLTVPEGIISSGGRDSSGGFKPDLSGALEFGGAIGGGFLLPELPNIGAGAGAAAGNAVGQTLENVLFHAGNEHILEDSLKSGVATATGGKILGAAAKPITGLIHGASKGVGIIPIIGPALKNFVEGTTAGAVPGGQELLKKMQPAIAEEGSAFVNSIDDITHATAIKSSQKTIANSAKESSTKLYNLAEKVAGNSTSRAKNTFSVVDDIGDEISTVNDPTGRLSEGLKSTVNNIKENGEILTYKQLRNYDQGLGDFVESQRDPITRKLSSTGEKALRLQKAVQQDLDNFAGDGLTAKQNQTLKAAHTEAKKFYQDEVVPTIGKTAKQITRTIEEKPEKLSDTILNSSASVDKIKKVIGSEGMGKLQSLYKKRLYEKATTGTSEVTGLKEINPAKFKDALTANETLARKVLGSTEYERLLKLAQEGITNPNIETFRAIGRALGTAGGALLTQDSPPKGQSNIQIQDSAGGPSDIQKARRDKLQQLIGGLGQ